MTPGSPLATALVGIQGFFIARENARAAKTDRDRQENRSCTPRKTAIAAKAANILPANLFFAEIGKELP